MPAINRRSGEIYAVHLLAMSLFVIPAVSYSTEGSHQDRVTGIVVDKTKKIMTEIDRVNPSPLSKDKGEEQAPVKDTVEEQEKEAIEV